MARKTKARRRKAKSRTSTRTIVVRAAAAKPARRKRRTMSALQSRFFGAVKRKVSHRRRKRSGIMGRGKAGLVGGMKDGLIKAASGVGGFYIGELLTPMIAKTAATKSYVNLGAGILTYAMLRKHPMFKNMGTGLAINGGINLLMSFIPKSTTPALKGLTQIRAVNRIPQQMGVNARFAGVNARFAGTPSLMGAGRSDTWVSPMTANDPYRSF